MERNNNKNETKLKVKIWFFREQYWAVEKDILSDEILTTEQLFDSIVSQKNTSPQQTFTFSGH